MSGLSEQAEQPSRKPLIAGNWKMNLNHLEAIAVTQKLAFLLNDKDYEVSDIALLPPFVDIRSVQTLIDGDRLRLLYGAQDLSPFPSGAYTGDISGTMLAKLGCTFVLVGHSERRSHHHESNSEVNSKVKAALSHGLTPILCVGESAEVRGEERHLEFVVNQLDESLAGITPAQVKKVVIAYEPIWAIGTGKTATAEDAQEMAAALRSRIPSASSRHHHAAARTQWDRKYAIVSHCVWYEMSVRSDPFSGGQTMTVFVISPSYFPLYGWWMELFWLMWHRFGDDDA